MSRSFQPASYSAIQSVYSGIPSAQSRGNLGEVSSSSRDKLATAREAYQKSWLAQNPVTSPAGVKNRWNLHSYVAYMLNAASQYPWSSDSDAALVAEQLRFLSTSDTTRIGNLITGNLTWYAKTGIGGKNIFRQAIKALNDQIQSGSTQAFNSAERKAIQTSADITSKVQLASEVEAATRAKMEAEGYTKAPAAPAAGTLNSKLLAGKWTDGKYTYEITASGDIKIGSKSYPTSDAKYAALAANLNKDFSDGKLTSGSAPKKSYTAPAEVYTPPATTDAATPGLQDAPSIMEAWWFWPAIGVGTLAVGGGVYFAFLRKK
jgi:hypothetical protein